MKCTNLRKKAIEGIKLSNHSRKEIADATGLGFDWINKLAQGRIPDPGVNKIEKLLGFLNK